MLLFLSFFHRELRNTNLRSSRGERIAFFPGVGFGSKRAIPLDTRVSTLRLRVGPALLILKLLSLGSTGGNSAKLSI